MKVIVVAAFVIAVIVNMKVAPAVIENNDIIPPLTSVFKYGVCKIPFPSSRDKLMDVE